MPHQAGGSNDAAEQVPIGSGPEQKLTANEANFRKQQGVSNFRCGDCTFYQNRTCEIVAVNDVDPNDICDEFQQDLRGKSSLGSSTGPKIIGQESVPGVQKSYIVNGLLKRVTPAVAIAQMYITRVGRDRQTGKLKWYSSASGIERDLYDERMSVTLFKDFIKRVEKREEVPSPFASKAWNGGLPYLSVAHYLDLEGKGIAGDTEQVYVDGEVFKAKGLFRDTPMGLAAYKSIRRDIDSKAPLEKRVRISIAFVDWAHEHEGFGDFSRSSLIDRCDMCDRGLGEKIYRAGQLVHLALTRRPAYPQANIALEESDGSEE